jgi:hypothetical protein
MAAINWKTGISGNWSQASNWSTGNVPGIGDNVTVDATGSYAVTVDGFNNPVSSLAFNAPTARIAIASSRSLQVEEVMMITGGTIDGPGDFFTGGVVSITGQPLTLGGGLIWDTYAPRLLTTSDVNISSAINIGDAAGLTATIRNRGTFNLTTDSAGIGLNLVVGSLGIANFDNGFGGTLAKTGGTGTSHFFANYTDISNINIGSGAVVISTGTLEFDGSNNFGGTISGGGTVAFGSGSSQFRVNPTVSNFLIGGGSVTFSNTLNTLETSRKRAGC